MKSKSSKPAAPVVEVAAMSPDNDERERKYRAEDGLRTLAEAEKVKRDPKLMADIEKARKAKMADLASIKCEVSPKTIKGAK
jgi:hypothetical protein